MKSFNTFFFYLCISLFSLNASSTNQQQTISKGQTKTITLNMAGAFTAKSVSVSGRGVNETSTTNSTRGSSPLLKWNRLDNADKYTIRYKKYNPHLAIPNLPGTGHPSRATAQNSYRIPRLQPGHYVWCVLGSHSPPKQSALKPTAGACSTKKTFIIQKT